MLLTIPFPSWLKPEIIPGLPVRWYGLMYAVAFGIAYLLYRRQVRERNFPITEDDLVGLFTWGIAGLIIGARVFSTLVYETSDIYRHQPWLIFWPFRDGRFTGLAGMSYHGGVIGCAMGTIIYSAVKHFDIREILDMFGASIPLGYTFGRLGNFINGELYGRVTTGPLGMLFPHAQPLPAGEAWVREAAEKTGIPIPDPSAWINLPRHPSQLYEAILEGVVTWSIIWIFRNRKPFKGFLIGMYIFLYGFFRVVVEYFREPDEDLGYRIEFIKSAIPPNPAISHPLLSFSTGQILSFSMILIACIWLIIVSRLPNREPIRVYPVAAEGGRSNAASKAEREEERKKQRKLRKKLR
ncbi:prolipoprotein diacylglyceryl transferase [Spirochaetia bacterium]|nr:prolipoprotein diacylglyceryl transferase [Spirochaetia bacterium]